MEWKVDEACYSDCGEDYYYYEITDGDKVFKADEEADANWLCNLLNKEN